MKLNLVLIAGCFSVLVSSCCKDKDDNKDVCISASFQVQPFFEKYGYFQCQNNDEYTYLYRRKSQIDSLDPPCFLAKPVPFPTNETDMIYVIIGKTAYHYKDTFNTRLLKDTCLKTFTYEVDMIQRDTAYNTFPGVVSMFCSVENIPTDYQVEVKYKYVPIQ